MLDLRDSGSLPGSRFVSCPSGFSLVSAGKGAVFAVAYRGATYALPIASDGTVGPPIVPRPAGSEA